MKYKCNACTGEPCVLVTDGVEGHPPIVCPFAFGDGSIESEWRVVPEVQ